MEGRTQAHPGGLREDPAARTSSTGSAAGIGKAAAAAPMTGLMHAAVVSMPTAVHLQQPWLPWPAPGRELTAGRS
jgi:tetrahydromethanopterin S-methyltransferase subunit D